MQHLPYEECRQIERTHVCAVCLGGLVTVWDPKANSYAVACSEDRTHQGFRHFSSYWEARQMGLPIPLEVEQQFQRKEEREVMEQLERTDQTLRALVPREDSATSKALTEYQVKMLIDYAEILRLNAYLGHVDIYQGRPRVTIYGRYYDARRHPEYGYIRTRPLDFNERQAQRVEDPVHAWLAEVIGKDGEILGAGYGYASDDEEQQLMKGVPEKWGLPQRRAEKRAEEDALAKAFPIGLPVLGEEDNEDTQPHESRGG